MSAMPFRATEKLAMSDKLSVNLWGASISAEGLIAIVAAVVIVGVLAFVMLRRA